MERNFVDGYVEWQANPEITGVNRLPQHATFMPYASFAEAQKGYMFLLPTCASPAGSMPFCVELDNLKDTDAPIHQPAAMLVAAD
jgi:beta-galactosidase